MAACVRGSACHMICRPVPRVALPGHPGGVHGDRELWSAWDGLAWKLWSP